MSSTVSYIVFNVSDGASIKTYLVPFDDLSAEEKYFLLLFKDNQNARCMRNGTLDQIDLNICADIHPDGTLVLQALLSRITKKFHSLVFPCTIVDIISIYTNVHYGAHLTNRLP